MLWIVKGDESHQIISCNLAEKNGKFQIWVERPNGKTMKIEESDDKQYILDIKEAIDFAIETRETTLRLA